MAAQQPRMIFLFLIMMQGPYPRPLELNLQGWNPETNIFLSSQVRLGAARVVNCGWVTAKISPAQVLQDLLLSDQVSGGSALCPQRSTLPSRAPSHGTFQMHKSSGPKLQQDLRKQSTSLTGLPNLKSEDLGGVGGEGRIV